MGKIRIEGQELIFAAGETIADVALRNSIPIEQPCGGRGTCGKCTVRDVDSSALLLACQNQARDGMDLTLLRTGAEAANILEFGAAMPERVSPELVPSILQETFHAPARGGIYGIALDIGTTTLAASLVDLETGVLRGTASCANPQSAYGADVISRIAYAASAPDGLKNLRAGVVEAANTLIEKLAEGAGIDSARIFHLIAAGNTTMEHCFLGVSPESIGRAPFEPAFYRAGRRRAEELGLRVNPLAYVDLMPNITGFVGGDLTAGVYHTNMHESQELTLLIDIGTNNEMILGNRDFLLACSTAAGPALEGARIRDGMRAGYGAIEHVRFENGDVACAVIGEVPPVGICGSGLVDAISGMLEAGVISPSGKISAPEEMAKNPYADRIVATPEGKEFRLAAKQDAGFVAITQKDIRETQLAKGAIATGVKMLLAHAGKKLEEVDRVLLAGAFGNYLDIENAIRLGIVPDVPRERIMPVGNSAGLGCFKALLDKGAVDRMEKIARGVRHIELAASPEFQETFIENLAFETTAPNAK